MTLPSMTHLQFFVVKSIGLKKVSAGYLRAQLEAVGNNMTAPAFYQMMDRLVEVGWCEKTKEEGVVDSGYKARFSFYTVTDLGRQKVKDTIAFYLKEQG